MKDFSSTLLAKVVIRPVDTTHEKAASFNCNKS